MSPDSLPMLLQCRQAAADLRPNFLRNCKSETQIEHSLPPHHHPFQWPTPPSALSTASPKTTADFSYLSKTKDHEEFLHHVVLNSSTAGCLYRR